MNFYHLKSNVEYEKACASAKTDLGNFWKNIAKANFIWQNDWQNTCRGTMQKANFTWFDDAELNITTNCIDRHLADKGDKIAIIFEPNNPKEVFVEITYQTLYNQVCKFANVLLKMGVQKGDRVCIYMPMIPELTYAMLACARIGAVHVVVFAGFSSNALAARILDCNCTFLITADGGYRGNKIIDLKSIADDALAMVNSIKVVLVAERVKNKPNMIKGRDYWLNDLLLAANATNIPAILNAEDSLFVLYTSGSTGKPKGMLHTCAGYMVYAGFTFKNVFQYQENDIYWCTADIGWITGHSYLIYGPLLNGATTLMFEGIPSFPDYGRFWQIIEKHKVNQFYTAPTAIRALAKESLDFVKPYNLSSLKVLGSVGEPINEEAWNWYDVNIGQRHCPIVDTWWQTETGGVMIAPLPNIHDTIPAFASKPLPGIFPELLSKSGSLVDQKNTTGNLCIKHPWPGMARSIWGDHQRFIDTYFSAFSGFYFTGDGAFFDENRNFRITGRVDDVIIVSGHNLGTAPIEEAIDEHKMVAESAIVGFHHDVKGSALYGFVILKQDVANLESLAKEINECITKHIGPIAKLDKIQFVTGLPKTRSGKIMRRLLRKIANHDFENLGDISTLLNPEIVEEIKRKVIDGLVYIK